MKPSRQKPRDKRLQTAVAGSDLLNSADSPLTARGVDSNSGQLLRDIAKLDVQFCAAMDDPRRLDRVRGVWGANSPYEDFAPKVHSAADRCRAAFDQGELNLARDAYAALFQLLMRKDSYGFPVARPKGMEMRQEYPRYLRAVIETNLPDKQAVSVMTAWRELRAGIWDADEITITGILQCRTQPLDGLKRILLELLPLLRGGEDIQDDRWLREAVRLRDGKSGLSELARREGERRPYAWLDLLHLIAAENNPPSLLSTAKEALMGIPEGLNLRALAADFWFQAAAARGCRDQALHARWEAFRAAPTPTRLLDLRDAAGAESGEQQWLKRALRCVLEGGLALVAGPEFGCTGRADDRVFLEKGDGFHDYCCPGIIACIRLLVGDWRTALADANKEAATAWSENSQGLVIPVLLAWLAGWPSTSLPMSVAALVQEAMSLLDSPDEATPVAGARYRLALTESLRHWDSPAEARQSELTSQCIRLVTARINVVAEQHYSGAYRSAATLAWAASAVLSSKDSVDSGKKFLDELIACHRGNPEFVTVLVSAH